MSLQKVAIIGLGYVGLPLGLLAAQKGYAVVGVDLSESKVDLINQKVSPFEDTKIQNDLKSTTLIATTDFAAVKESDIVIICVPTPVDKNRLPDYGPVESACTSIAPHLRPGQLIILESTVNPGVCEEIVIPLIQAHSSLRFGRDLLLAHCPERINPGDTKWHAGNIPRVVGGFDKDSLDQAVAFYTSIVDAQIYPMANLKEAEAVKVVENSFRNVNIAFVNELAKSFSRLGIDVVNVINGAATKPYSFLAHYPGCGVGGHCIPVDPYYLIDYSKKTSGFEHKFLKLALTVNESMPVFTVDLLEEGLIASNLPVSGTKVAVLGLAYKANISDTRESPSLEIIHELKNRGLVPLVYDPHVLSQSDAKSLSEVLSQVTAVILATNHSEFTKLSPSDFESAGVKVVIDGKNCLSKSDFSNSKLYYRGIGR